MDKNKIINVNDFYAFHYAMKAAGDNQRLGQRFINMYIKDEHKDSNLVGLWEASEPKAKDIIVVWLCDHQYYGTMPPLLDRS